MKINIADLITIDDDEKYITLDVLEYEGVEYAFVNKLTSDEEPTDELYIFTVDEDEEDIVKITDEELINKLLPKFQKRLEEQINKIMNEESE